MKYTEAMDMLSQCGLGAALLGEDGDVLSVNAAGDALLHGGGGLVGRRLADIAAPLCQDTGEPLYFRAAFDEYLLRSPAPEPDDLPPRSRLVVFRRADADFRCDALTGVLNRISESVILCDDECRIFLLNDAATKMDSIVTQDVLGEDISSVYREQGGEDLFVPQAIRDKRPIMNKRQHYTTRFGRSVDIVANNFPILKNGQVLGGFSVMEDCSAIDDLHKQLIDLREKVLNDRPSGKGKPAGALTATYKFKDIIYVSSVMSFLLERCRRVAKTDSSVMICGETGTGKELVAQSIHNASSRASGPFLAINCAAIPENLLEGLLFGTEKGAYTGAESRAGLFEQANHGTLLLDEINSMDMSLQSKLLRVLQDGIIRRVGGMSQLQVDVRVLSNINIPPEKAIADNRLRRDLYYRLGVVSINIPPLRERVEDIPLLAKSFIMSYDRKLVKNVQELDAAVLRLFQEYEWPGNVRELQHAIEHAMNLMPDSATAITMEYIPEHITARPASGKPQPTSRPDSLSGTIRSMERAAICKTLRENGGNISEAARVLKMSRQNLQYHIKKYGIDIPSLLADREYMAD